MTLIQTVGAWKGEANLNERYIFFEVKIYFFKETPWIKLCYQKLSWWDFSSKRQLGCKEQELPLTYPL